MLQMIVIEHKTLNNIYNVHVSVAAIFHFKGGCMFLNRDVMQSDYTTFRMYVRL